MIERMLGTMVATALVAAPVHAACWTADDTAAATVRELQSMLMVATLRCQVSGHAILADYNGFVAANRPTIASMNDRLKAHFIHAAGAVEGQRAYDRFTTSLANGYGAGASGAEVCAGAASLAREGSLMAGSAEALLLLAERAGVAPHVDAGTCDAPVAAAPLTVASNTVVIPGPLAAR